MPGRPTRTIGLEAGRTVPEKKGNVGGVEQCPVSRWGRDANRQSNRYSPGFEGAARDLLHRARLGSRSLTLQFDSNPQPSLEPPAEGVVDLLCPDHPGQGQTLE